MAKGRPPGPKGQVHPTSEVDGDEVADSVGQASSLILLKNPI